MINFKEFLVENALIMIIALYSAIIIMTSPLDMVPTMVLVVITSLVITTNYFTVKMLRKGVKNMFAKVGLFILAFLSSGVLSLLVIPLALYNGRKELEEDLIILKGSLL